MPFYFVLFFFFIELGNGINFSLSFHGDNQTTAYLNSTTISQWEIRSLIPLIPTTLGLDTFSLRPSRLARKNQVRSLPQLPGEVNSVKGGLGGVEGRVLGE